MLIDETRFFWKSLMSKFEPIMDLYSQLRPLIFLPFNIWFFFASLPFRLFFSFTSIFFSKKDTPALQQMKEKANELKEEVVIPTLLPQQPRKFVPMPDRQFHGWYAVESKKEDRLTRRKSHLKHSQESQESQQPQQPQQSQLKEESPRVDESVQLKEQLSLIEQRERQTLEDKQRLELQLEDLSKKYNSDEQALASFEHEKQRFRNLIKVEQKKCFDFQQQIISLKNQLKSEHESKLQVEGQLDALKKKEKTDKRKASKARKASTPRSDMSATDAGKESLASEPAVESTRASSETTSVWHSTEQKSFTEMVAEAQRDELEHGKKFSEIVKESIKKEEPAFVESKSEFVVVGGDLSSKHIVAN